METCSFMTIAIECHRLQSNAVEKDGPAPQWPQNVFIAWKATNAAEKDLRLQDGAETVNIGSEKKIRIQHTQGISRR